MPSKNGNEISGTNSKKTANERLNKNQRLVRLLEENAVLKKQISELQKKNHVLETKQIWFNTLLKDISNRIVEKVL